jgi:hypothetical protein
MGIGEFWDTLGGETKSDGKGDTHDQQQPPNSNKRTEGEKN